MISELEELLEYVCDSICHKLEGLTQEEAEEVCKQCSLNKKADKIFNQERK